MLKNFNIRKATLAISAICCVLGVHSSVSAQNIDTGTVNVNGAVRSATCQVKFRVAGNTGFSANPVLELGTVKSTDFLVSGASEDNPIVVGSKRPIVVATLASPTDATQKCDLGGINRKWDLAITNAFPGGANGKFLAAPGTGVTNALVRIRAVPVADPTSDSFLTTPNNVNISDKTSNIGTGTDTFRSNFTAFQLQVNCASAFSQQFTPKVTMRFNKPVSNSCLADNEATANAASLIKAGIFTSASGTPPPSVCPSTAAAPTTLPFKQSTSNVIYSDTMNLFAAFVVDKGTLPTPGSFATNVTFTLSFN